MSRVFIFGAGEMVPLRAVPEAGDFVIAADGGMSYLDSLGIKPDLIIGDFDSSSEPVSGDVIKLPVEKDDTDSVFAVRYALEHGYKEIHIYGGTGGRFDHTIANIQILSYIAEHQARGYLYSPEMVMTVIQGNLTIESTGIFSVFSLSGISHGVSITGGFYEMHDGEISSSFPIGVSNHSVGKPVTVKSSDGTLLIMWADHGKASQKFIAY
ncbi:MAG: thiamine diphosphokinase [Oscillospiraceae bacterium]|nr:thiamine diphosphokinase [Ruminococcus sp.]MCD8344570.1 thiamine diphosphokinase [Oscillospiraceae bacterium]